MAQEQNMAQSRAAEQEDGMVRGQAAEQEDGMVRGQAAEQEDSMAQSRAAEQEDGMVQGQAAEQNGTAQEEEGAPAIEESFQRLDVLLERLQDPAVSLEDAFAAYTEGMELVKQCSARIDLVEKKVRILNGEGETDEF